MPTNLAATLYNKTQGKVQLLALNTLGVLYVVEAGDTIQSIGDLAGKTVGGHRRHVKFPLDDAAHNLIGGAGQGELVAVGGVPCGGFLHQFHHPHSGSRREGKRILLLSPPDASLE